MSETNETGEPVTPEVMPDAPGGDKTAVTIANALAAQVAGVAEGANWRIKSAAEWLEANGGNVTEANRADAKNLRSSLNRAADMAADLRKEIQRKVAEAFADTIQPLVDAEKRAKSLSAQFKTAIDVLDEKPRCNAPHYIEVVCDQYQWPKITEACGKVLKSGGSFAELDPAWIKIPKNLQGGNVPL